MTDELKKKVDRAIKLIQSAAPRGGVIEVSYSGGKDSDVILELTKMAGVKYRAIYKNTTIDPPYTIKHCKDNGVEILRPKYSFLELIEKSGMPTRRARFCCQRLKEYKVLDDAIQGIRRCESVARSERYSEQDPIICRIYGNNKRNHVNVCLPILSWSDEDVAEFVAVRHIKCHPLYYDEQGNFHPERRLGCIGCPMQSDQGKNDFLKYPKLLKAIVRATIKWYNSHPKAKSRKNFRNPYALVAHNIFFKSYEDFKTVDDGLFGQMDWKTKLEEYFNIKLK